MRCKERLEAYLREHQVPFEEQKHARVFSAQKIAESEHVSNKEVAKVVIAFADNKMISLVLPASFQVDFDKAKRLLGAKEVWQAHESEFVATFPDCEVGTMPPFGNLYGLPVYVEKSLTEQEMIIFPVGTYTDTMSVKYSDFERLVQPTVGEFAWTKLLA